MDRSIYYYAVLGAFCGLAGWFVGTTMLCMAPTEGAMPLPLLLARPIALGALASLAVTVYERYAFGAAQSGREVAMALCIGAIVGLAIGLLGHTVIERDGDSMIVQFLVFGLLGLGIGMAVGVEVNDMDWRRLGLSAVGGLIGGLLGAACIYVLRGSFGAEQTLLAEAVGHAVCLMFVALGAAIVPILAGDGTVRIIQSDFPSVGQKYREGRIWSVNRRLTIGSSNALRRADLYIPDPEKTAPRHAEIRLVDGEGMFLHRLIDDPGYVLKVRGKPLRPGARRERVRDGDTLTVGRTTLQLRISVRHQ